MCRSKENGSNEENKMEEDVFEKESLKCHDKGNVYQKLEPNGVKLQSINEMRHYSDEQSYEEIEKKLLKNVVTCAANGNVEKNEKHTVITDNENLDNVDLSVSNCQQDDKKLFIPKMILPEPSYAFFSGISVFCFSQQGDSHIKNNIPCQDRSGFKVIGDKIVVAAIADGVGSCELSDYGAEVAINASLSFLEQYFICELKQDSFEFDSPEKMGKTLRDMMRYAFENVERRALELQILSYSFQSTLTVAVYDGNTLYFAHAGDDGIVALNNTGTYALVTSRHKGDEANSVYPLQSQNTWQFGKVNDTVAFVMATDGVLDAFVRPLVENNRIYYPFIEPVFYNSQVSDSDAKRACYDWYEYMASSTYRASVTDDLSFIGIVNQETIKTSVKPQFEIDKWEQQTKEYHEKRKVALYPPKSEIESNSEVTTSGFEKVIRKNAVSGKGKSKVCTHETRNNTGRPTGIHYYNKLEQGENIKTQYNKGSVNSSDSAKQAREAAKKVNDGMKEFVAASAVILLKGIGRASSYFGETMEQASEEMKKKNNIERLSESNNYDERS